MGSTKIKTLLLQQIALENVQTSPEVLSQLSSKNLASEINLRIFFLLSP